MNKFLLPCRGARLLVLLALSPLLFGIGMAQEKSRAHGTLDVRVNPTEPMPAVPGATPSAIATRQSARAARMNTGVAAWQARVTGFEVTVSPVTGAAEVVSAGAPLTPPAPGRAGFDIVQDFLSANFPLYGLTETDLANLRFIGESISPGSGLRMVRVEQRVNERPVFQSETRFILDREGRVIRSVGLLVPEASDTAPAPVTTVSAENALATALRSVELVIDPAEMTRENTNPKGTKTELVAHAPQVVGKVPSELVYFAIAPGVLLPAWSQVTFTTGAGDWYTLVDARTGKLLWRKNIRAHASNEEARFSVYVQADGKTPADSPSPLSPTNATPGSNTQPPGIARTTVSMLAVQDVAASPNGWIPDGATTTSGNNTDTYLDRVNTTGEANVPDIGALDNNGRPTGNPDAAVRNRDFLGLIPRDFQTSFLPAPQGGNPEAGQTATGAPSLALDSFRRGVVTHLFYLTNWYHDQLYQLGFDEAAGNFQQANFSGMGLGNDRVLAEAQDGSGTNNANFSTPPDGQSGRMQMFIFNGPTIDRDGSLDAEIVIHELTHGLSNRLIGNGAGLNWDIGAGMGEGWSDFYALCLLNNTNADAPNGKYASGGYATYKLSAMTDNYLYGIRRFPYSTDNSVNPLTWADADDITNNLGGGIAASPVNFNGSGACEVHNLGELWANTLWEVRSRIIADPAGANGDVPTGNRTTLEIVTDGMKMTPISPSFLEGRDAIIAADAAGNAGANEESIWGGFADRGLGYNALAPTKFLFGYRAGHLGLRESFDVPYLDVQSVAINDGIGNNNGALDPNEPAQLVVQLKNPWRKAAKGVASATATLTTSTPGVVITTGNSTYGAIPALGSVNGTPFQISVPSGALAGQLLNFTIAVTSTLGTKGVDFSLRVGAPAGNGAPLTFTRSSLAQAIPDNAPRGVVSTLTVPTDSEIADINFRVDNLTHTFTGDVTLLLKGPSGYGTELVAAIGGINDGGSGDNVVNLEVDDQAVNSLLGVTAAAAPYTGSWLPAFNTTAWDSVNGFNSHDPVGQLSRFNNTSTLGDWKVLVSDQFSGDAGILNSWSIIITPKAYSVTPFTNPGPTIGGAVAAQPVNDNAALAPFGGVTIAHPTVGQALGVSVLLDSAGKGSFTTLGGFTDGGGGLYTFGGTADAATAALRALVFAPTANRVAPGATETTTFTITVNDGITTPVANNATSVVATSINDAPVIVAQQPLATSEDTSLSVAFGDVAVSDPDHAYPNGFTLSLQNGVNYSTVGNSVTPVANFEGVLTVPVTVNDGVDSSAVFNLSVSVTAVNDPPTFVKGPDQTVLEDAGAQTVAGWASAVSSGPANEAGQSLSFVVSSDNPALFASAPAIDPNGTLLFTPAANASGSTTVTVVLLDSGGTLGGGADTSAPATFTISILTVNDAPSFAIGPDQGVTPGGGTQTVPNFATGISPGPADESAQALGFNVSTDNDALFTVLPAISPSGTLTFTPAPGSGGSANVTVVLQDNGGTALGGADTSAAQTFAINTGTVNDPPTFTIGPDQSVPQDAGPQTVPNFATNISPGPADEASQLVDFQVELDRPDLFAALPSISPDGTLTYSPAAAASGTALVTVRLHDDGPSTPPNVPLSAPQTFRIAITDFAEGVGTYNGLALPSPGATPGADKTGLLKLTLTKRGEVTGRLKLGGLSQSFRGTIADTGLVTFGRAGETSVTLRRRGLSNLVLSALRIDGGGGDSLTGTILDGGAPFATITGDRALYTSNRNPVPPRRNVPLALEGKYTVLFDEPRAPGLPATDVPHGDGYGTLVVKNTGVAKITGRLADGSRFSYANALSKENSWPLNIATATGQGAVAGWVRFEPIGGAAPSDLNGLGLLWFKPQNPRAKYFPSGWPLGIATDLAGSTYLAPPRGGLGSALPGLEFLPADADGNAKLTLTAGGLPNPLSKALGISERNKVIVITPAADKLKVSIKATSGVIKGSFVPPGSTRRVLFQGVIYQKQQFGSGYFLGPTQSGAVSLVPAAVPGVP